MSVIGPATLSSVSDNADGTYTATITSSTDEVETVTVSAGFNNSKVGNTVDIRFTIPEIDDDSPPVVVAIAANSTLEASSYGVNTHDSF
jgi:hypothetical protein